MSTSRGPAALNVPKRVLYISLYTIQYRVELVVLLVGNRSSLRLPGGLSSSQGSTYGMHSIALARTTALRRRGTAHTMQNF